MKQTYSLLIMLLVALSVNSQTIAGKLLNKSNEPIAYATLQIGPSYGVITNEEGNFILKTKRFSPTDIVLISCLGYEPLTVVLSNFDSKTYYLNEAKNTLSEVYLTNKQLTTNEILDSIRENLSKNYSQLGTKKVFLRKTNTFKLHDMDFDIARSSNLSKSKIKSFNNTFDELKNQVINKDSKFYEETLFDYSKKKDTSFVSVIKATKLINKIKDISTEAVNGKMIENSLRLLDSTATYKLKTGMFTLEDSLKVGGFENKKANPETGKNKTLTSQIEQIIQANYPSENSKLEFLFEQDKYDYNVDDISYIGDVAAYKVSFQPRKRSAKYVGNMYVNTSDFAIMRLDYGFAEDRTGKKLNLKLLLGVKFVENVYKSNVIFVKNENNRYDLQFVNSETGNYIYLNRSLKFIRNKIDESEDKQFLKIKLMLEQDYRDKTELFFINHQPVSSSEKSNSAQSEYPIDYISKYDVSLWKDYNILSPVQDILDYETEE